MSGTEDNSSEPGAMIHGNFICYYDFHPAEERLKLISYDFLSFSDSLVVILDVGCNTGDLTRKFVEDFEAQTHRSTQCLGIDIDPNLIERTQLNNQRSNITFQCHDVTSDSFYSTASEFLQQFSKQTFDIITLFSITMWIHLNHGDSGLMATLKRLASLTKYMIVEAQPWKCYRAAQRRVKRAGKPMFAHWPTIKFRETIEKDIRDFLSGECSMKIVAESPERTAWGRQIIIYEEHARN